MSGIFDRQPGGYVTASAVALGAGLHCCVSCFYLLATKSTLRNWSWKISVGALISVMLYILLQMLLLDFMNKSYVAPSYYFGLIQVSNYAIHCLAAIGITGVLITRLTVFYDTDSRLMNTMYILGGMVALSKLVYDAFGVMIGISLMKLEYLRYEDHPYYLYLNLAFATSSALGMGFSVLGSIGFLTVLTQNKTKKEILKDVIVKLHGYRLFLICLLHACVCASTIFGIFRVHTALTHIGTFLPAAIVSLELNTFLELSYLTPIEIRFGSNGNSYDNTNMKYYSQ